MNAVGIDVSKGKSTVAILRPGGEVVASPFEVSHNPRKLNELVSLIKSLNGDSKILMEYTGNYYLPVALSSKSPVYLFPSSILFSLKTITTNLYLSAKAKPIRKIP